MISRVAVARSQPLPAVLRYTDIRSYVFTLAFVFLSVATPWVFHQFHLAGPTFLPMHLFVLIAGLLFGWRAGLIVGLLTPVASFASSGMPGLAILPQVTVELSVYGLVAGLLREKFNLRAIWALVGAMIAGRLALGLTVLVVYLLFSQVFSPLGPAASPLAVVWATIEQGWPGVAIQLVSIPAIAWLVGKMTAR